MWAIPGGFKRPTETLDEAARRELVEETAVDVPSLLTQFGAYGDPERDPRMNVVTVGYLAVLRDVGAVMAGTDAAVAALVPVSDVLNGRIELRSTICRSCGTQSSAFASSSRSRASRPRSWERRHPGRATGGVRGRLGVQLDAANFRRSIVAEDGLGDPHRAPSATRPVRRTARRAVSRWTGMEPRRSDPSIPARREEVTYESRRSRHVRTTRSPPRGGRHSGTRRTTRSSSGFTPPR